MHCPQWRSYSIQNFNRYPSWLVFKKCITHPYASTFKAYTTMLLNFTHTVTGYSPMIHFHDAKALNYEPGTVKQKHMPHPACSAMQHAAQGRDAVSPIYMFWECTSPWKLSTQAESKCLRLVHKLSKQELVGIWCLPSFSEFIWITDAWWPLIIEGLLKISVGDS